MPKIVIRPILEALARGLFLALRVRRYGQHFQTPSLRCWREENNLRFYTALVERYAHKIAAPGTVEQHMMRAAARCAATSLDLVEQTRDLVGRSTKHPRPADDSDGGDGDGGDDNDHDERPRKKPRRK